MGYVIVAVVAFVIGFFAGLFITLETTNSWPPSGP